MEAIERQPGRFRGNQACSASVAEQQETQHLLELPLFLEMQTGEFEVDHQHLRVRFGTHDVAGKLQCVHRGEASHEPDDGTLDRWGKSGLAHDVEIESRCREAGAACDDQMGDRGAVPRDVQCSDRLHRKRQRLALEAGHPVARRGEAAAAVKALAVEEAIPRLRPRCEERVTMPDVRQSHHAVEQRPRTLVRQGGAGEVDEFRVDVVRRNRGADPVEPGLGHPASFVLGPGCKDAARTWFIPTMWGVRPNVL